MATKQTNKKLTTKKSNKAKAAKKTNPTKKSNKSVSKSPKRSSKSKSVSSGGFRVAHMMMFVLVFGILGGIATYFTHAATPFHAAPGSLTGALASSWENSDNFVARDEGYSVELPNQKVLWIFGDSLKYKRGTKGAYGYTSAVNGSTAILGPSNDPPISFGTKQSKYVEVHTSAKPQKSPSFSSSAEPVKFIPQDPKTYIKGKNGVECNVKPDYQARWVTGATRVPKNKFQDDSLILVTFMDVCVMHEGGKVTFPVEGWGFAIYNWRTNSFDIKATDVVTPAKDGHEISPAVIYSSPTFAGGDLYLFSAQCTGTVYGSCPSGVINASIIPGAASFTGDKLGRQLAALTHPGHTHPPTPLFYTGSQGDGGPINPLVSIAKVPGGLRMMTQTSVAGNFSVYKSADNNPGHWNLQQVGQIPACAGPQADGGFCRALTIHSESSRSNNLSLTYYDPDAIPLGTNPARYTGEIVFAPAWTAKY